MKSPTRNVTRFHSSQSLVLSHTKDPWTERPMHHSDVLHTFCPSCKCETLLRLLHLHGFPFANPTGVGLLAGTAARAHDVERCEDRSREESRPSKSTDHHGPDHHITRSAQDQVPLELLQRQEAGEPEQTGQGVEREYDPFVEEAAVGLAAAGEDGVEEEVGEGEEGEGCDEDEVGG